MELVTTGRNGPRQGRRAADSTGVQKVRMVVWFRRIVKNGVTIFGQRMMYMHAAGIARNRVCHERDAQFKINCDFIDNLLCPHRRVGDGDRIGRGQIQFDLADSVFITLAFPVNAITIQSLGDLVHKCLGMISVAQIVDGLQFGGTTGFKILVFLTARIVE